MREALRTIDAIKIENNYLLEKFPEYYDLIGKEARNAFSNGLTAAELKYSLGFNMHGTRDFTINEHSVDVFCPRCSESEESNHAVKCRCIEESFRNTNKIHAIMP